MKKMHAVGKKKRTLLIISGLVLLLVIYIYLNNGPLFLTKHSGKPFLLAHRGVAQTFHPEGITNDTCTATRIYPPEHQYLENTIASMREAFQLGADMVEFDIQPTRDGKFAIFHDWTLDCRTNGKGVTRDHTLAELQKLDIGYGYSADGGKTFPFRGKGVGLMPSLDEVMHTFPDRAFLIHIKSNDPQEGTQLANYLSNLPEQQQRLLTVYGGDKPVAVVHQRLPQLKVMSVETEKSCMVPYLALGWTGYVSSACHNIELHIPEKVAPWLWGWPDRFLDRMAAVDTRVIVVGGDGSEFSTGFDSPADIQRLPADYSGGIWTNRIDKIAPLYRDMR
jgi:glycerophosphoryl diester phosphodiesterase